MDSLTLDLVKPIRNRNGSFENPFKSSISFPGGGRVCKFLREKFVGAITGPRAPTQQEINENLPVTKPDLQRLNSPPVDKLQYIWIGHATMLYQTDGWNILSDPIWSERCSPFSFLGPKRYRPPPLPMEDLPRIDAVVISHNHYDHLDIHSVTTLNKLFGKSLHWLVPEGLKGWFLARNCETVTELSWWQSVTLKMEGKKDLEITCTPAQHWSLRSGCDRNQVSEQL
ncbi:NAPEPLD [Bugula neritina]|uniref:NAPEPLD n=1 Tax=Bugula neritina TaxID=10212 RepID=A0A7J7ITP9_BUGNE|nr:NAPEPLD [Bugula neritina]